MTVNNSKPVKLGETNKIALPPQCHAFGVLGSIITLYFYVSSTVIRKNRNIDFLHIYIYIYIYVYIFLSRVVDWLNVFKL